MRAGIAVSVAAHGLILAWGVFVLPSSQPVDPSQFESLPVELVSLADTTRLSLGRENAPVKEELSASEPAPAIEPKPEPVPPPPPPAPPAPEPTPAPPPEPTPAPQPEPTPAPPQPDVAEPTPDPAPPVEAVQAPAPEPQPVAEPEPAPQLVAAPDPTPAPAPTPSPEPKPKPPTPAPTPEPAPVAVADAAPAPLPRARPRPPARTPEPPAAAPPRPPAQEQRQTAPQPDEKFTDDIANLLDRAPQPQAAPEPSDQTASLGVDRGGLEQVMNQGIYDGLIGQVRQCWSPMQGVIDSQQTVKARLFLNLDGSLREPPVIIQGGVGQFGQPADDAALRAIRSCAPFDVSAFPTDRYEEWKDIDINFRWSDY